MNNHHAILRAVAITALMLFAAPGAALAGSGSVVLNLDQAQLVPYSAQEMEKLKAAHQRGEFTTLASGAYSSSVMGPTLYSSNVWYKVTFPVVGTIPAGSTITSVYWTWSVSNYRSDLQVYLLHPLRDGRLGYIDISRVTNGGTNAFWDLYAYQPFEMWFYMPGTSNLYPPIYGQMDQVIVNYVTP